MDLKGVFCVFLIKDVDEVERRMIREALLRYCELDTLAMVMIVQAWQEAEQLGSNNWGQININF